MNFQSQNYRKAVGIAKKLQQNGHIAYFAGGCVRDYLMAKEPEDYDIATTAHPEQVEGLFPKTIPVGKQFGVMLVIDEDATFEVATFRKEDGYVDGRHPSVISFTAPEEDAKRRDFTVNGLFYDPSADKVLDFVNGQEDLRKGVIRAIGNPKVRFEEDKLRLLRAIRFSSSLHFEIESETWEAVLAGAAQIKQVSAERVRDELVKILTRPGAAQGFQLLSDSGLMREILPEIEAMKGVEQQKEYHPEGDVFVHTKLLLEIMDRGNIRDLTIALGALFHDVGKPPTFKIRNDKITFYEHAHVGAKMTEEIMRRLRFSNKEIDRVVSAVENHMKFGDVRKMRSGKLQRFMARDTFAKELELHRIDCQASHGMLDNFHFLNGKVEEFAKADLKPKPLISGHDLIKAGMSPGPKIKMVLEMLYDLQLEGRFLSRDEAVTYLNAHIQEWR